jgi:hypothetical protein
VLGFIAQCIKSTVHLYRINAVSLNRNLKNRHALKSVHEINLERVFMNKKALIFISVLMCLSQFANAGSRDRYDRRPGGRGYPPPPSSSSGVCKVAGASGYSYVSLNGNIASSLSKDVGDTVAVLQKLSWSGACRLQASSCTISAASGYSYISIDGNIATDLSKNINGTVQAFYELERARVCQPQSISCELKSSSGYYYVAINGNIATDLTSNVDQAIRELEALRDSRLCR